MNPEGHAKLRFLLEVAEREARHLLQTRERLFREHIDSQWVVLLEGKPDLSERVDAFATRFGRLQDTVGGKLVPELLRQMLETPGSALDNLNRVERLGLLESVTSWTEARNLRNLLVHEYMEDPEVFAQALNRANELVPLLTETYAAIRKYTEKHLGLT